MLQPFIISTMIRDATPQDATALANLIFKTWLATYIPLGVPREAIVQYFGDLKNYQLTWEKFLIEGDKSFRTILSTVEDQVVGICFGYQKDGLSELKALYVDTAYQAKGIGTALVNAMLTHFPAKTFVHVVESNSNAIGFYKKFGFVPTGDTSIFRLSNDIVLTEIVLSKE